MPVGSLVSLIVEMLFSDVERRCHLGENIPTPSHPGLQQVPQRMTAGRHNEGILKKVYVCISIIMVFISTLIPL